jgi:hypothetical protein
VAGHPGQQRVGQAGLGQRHRQRPDGLGVAAVDHAALVAAEGADAVAGAQERAVGLDDGVEDGVEVALGPSLDRRLRGGVVGPGEGSAAEQDAGPRREATGDVVDVVDAQVTALDLVGRDAEEAREGGVLVVRGGRLGPDREEQERPHGSSV